MSSADIKSLTDPRDWDDEIGAPFRWCMPGSNRGFRVDVDEDGDVSLTVGGIWTSGSPDSLSPDEARWLRDVWPAVILTVDAYTGGVQ